MGMLSRELRKMGFKPTGRESPIDEDGELWTNSHETVCDETGVVIDGNHFGEEEDDNWYYRHTYRYSGRARLPGSFTGD